MDERQMQFRVGLFVLIAFACGIGLVVRFGDVRKYWEESYPLALQFETAPGVTVGTPVQLNGIPIGEVREVLLDDLQPGVLVVVDIQEQYTLRKDSRPSIVRSLLGDSTIEFSPGVSQEALPPNKRIPGYAPQDPMEIVKRLEENVSKTLATFEETSQEWREVGRSLNSLMATREGQLDDVIEQTATALAEFTAAMKNANETIVATNQFVNDPELQKHLRETMRTLPLIADETRQTLLTARETIAATQDVVASTRVSIDKVNQNLDKVNANLDQVQAATAPLAAHSKTMVARLDGSLLQMESLLTELNTFATLVNKEDGTLQKFVSDPSLYKNLNQSVVTLTVMLDNLQPTLRDARVFADKIARHPELLGVSGALSGSAGVKEVSEANGVGRSSLSPDPIRR
ncbi:MAG: MlaD family protein [Planctomycetaceae bacterium]